MREMKGGTMTEKDRKLKEQQQKLNAGHYITTSDSDLDELHSLFE